MLGVASDATPEQIRDAYRRAARLAHPDRNGGNDARMVSINEAYRVLSDARRRYDYDRTLSGPTQVAARVDPYTDDEIDGGIDDGVEVDPLTGLTRPTRLAPAGPARVPWRLMVTAALVGSVVVLLASAFDKPPAEETPDGILRPGSCVAFEPNNDVREVACGGTADIVVDVLVPLDANCPGGTVGHRDRLGLGIACIPADHA